jgi:hypothetical protein
VDFLLLLTVKPELVGLSLSLDSFKASWEGVV